MYMHFLIKHILFDGMVAAHTKYEIHQEYLNSISLDKKYIMLNRYKLNIDNYLK